MTGPLAQQFAQVRARIESTVRMDKVSVPSVNEALAALSVIERHVQDMETALRGIAHAQPPKKGTSAHNLARDLAAVRLAARVVLDEWGDAPALPACEKGTE